MRGILGGGKCTAQKQICADLYTCTYILCQNEFQFSHHCPQVSPHGVVNNVAHLHQPFLSIKAPFRHTWRDLSRGKAGATQAIQLEPQLCNLCCSTGWVHKSSTNPLLPLSLPHSAFSPRNVWKCHFFLPDLPVLSDPCSISLFGASLLCFPKLLPLHPNALHTPAFVVVIKVLALALIM